MALSKMYFQTRASVQLASGLTFTRPNFSSHSTMSILARCFVWSRRMPLIQARLPANARSFGSTFRIAQQASGSRDQSASPYFAACCAGVISDT